VVDTAGPKSDAGVLYGAG